MKVIKICIIALTIGIFNTSCRNNGNCSSAKTESSASSVNTTAPADGTNAAAEVIVEEPLSNERLTANGREQRKASSTNVKAGAQRSRTWTGNRRNDTSKGPDLEASKRREGNFTNGTGLDYPGHTTK